MKKVLLFPGQGAQYPGMGKDLYDHYEIVKKIYKQAEEIVGWPVADICFGKLGEKIHQTRYTQTALFTTNYAIFKVLQEVGLEVSATLGFSLGEYNAIVASECLDFIETIKLVEKRAMAMEDCAQKHPGGMVAVLGLEAEKVKGICDNITQTTHHLVAVANDNCAGQITVAGEQEALNSIEEALKKAGAKRVVPLKVSGAFHTSLMMEAARALEETIKDLNFELPKIPIISNVTAQEMTKEEVKENIPLQITHGVRFREGILYLLDQGYDTFIEAGPKNTLSHLIKKIAKGSETLQAEDEETIRKVIEKVGDK